MNGFKTAALGLAAALTLALPAHAVETPQQELTAQYQCAGAMGLFDGYMEDPTSPVTEVDRTLAASLNTLEPRFRARDIVLDGMLGEETVRATGEALRADMMAKIEPLRGDPQARLKVVALFRPVLESCVVRGAALPAVP